MRKRLLVAITLLLCLLVGAPPASAVFFQERSTAASGTNGIALGPDGNFWVAEEFSGSVVRMAPSGAVVQRFDGIGTAPTSVASGPGGRVWVTVPGSNKLVWFDALSAVAMPHDKATPGACGPVAITSGGGDGNMYISLPGGVCGASQVARVADDASGMVTVAPGGGGTVYDLEVRGGKLYAPDFNGDVVRRLTLGSMAFEASVSLPNGSGADGITSDGAGNIWVTAYNSGKVARFPAAQSGGAATVYTPTGGTLVNPFGIVVGADGYIYVAGTGSANIVRVAPDGSAFAFYSLPSSAPFQIIVGPDSDPWFTDRSKTRIVHLVNGPPRATTGSAGPTSSTTASAQASINPRGNDTQIVFDYGTTTAYGSSSAPFTVLSGPDPVEVTGVLSALAPSTTYHVRVRASNAEGSVPGADTTFTTPAGIVDADNDGVSPPTDCNDNNAAIKPGAVDTPGDTIDQDCNGTDAEFPALVATTNFTPAGIVDADKDGVSPPTDCNDNNAAIKPGAVDTPGDKIDQDCSGNDAAFPELVATTNFTYSRGKTTVVVTRIDISRLRGGETATIKCTGSPRCAFTSKTYRNLKKEQSFGRALLRGRRLPARAKMQVRVTMPGTIGTYTVLEVRRGKRPKISRACLQPGAMKASACP